MDPQKLTPLKSITFTREIPSGASFETEAGPLELTFWDEDIVRLRLGKADLPDYGIIVGTPAEMKTSVTREDDMYVLRCGKGEVRLDPGDENIPVSLCYVCNDKTRIAPSTDGHFARRFRIPPFARLQEGWFFSIDLPRGVSVYGMGEKYSSLNRRGLLVENWAEDALGVNTEVCYKNAPFAWSPEGFGVFIHTPAKVSHGAGYPQWSSISYAALVEDEVLDVFFIAGDTPAQIIKRYTDLTGRAAPVPLWSLGNWICRAYYKDEQEASEIAKTIRKRQIPCDVYTLDGRAWLDTDTRFAFEWDASRYPEPRRFTRLMEELNMRLCVWEYPLISVKHPLFKELAEKGWLLKDKDGNAYKYEWDLSPFGKVLTPLPKSGMLDFTNPEAAEWWGKMHEKLFDVGVKLIKTDFGEQIPEDAVAFNGDSGKRLHNVYPLLYNLCVYKATRDYYGEDALVWGRSGWAGSQRAPIQWGGDPQVSWQGLAGSIVGGQAWGLSGVPYYSHDIGGFYGGQPDPELYIRWIQAGVLGSLCRIHGIGPREPWFFGEEAESICKEWLSLRYRLIPYLQRAGKEAEDTGMPVMRAMCLAFPEDRLAWPFELQYMLGDSLLVVPALKPGGEVTFYLPKGKWFDFFSGECLEGGRMLQLSMPLERIPVYVREASILALGPAVQHTGEISPENRIEELRVYGLPRPDALSYESDLAIKVESEGRIRIAGAAGIQVKAFGEITTRVDGADVEADAVRS